MVGWDKAAVGGRRPTKRPSKNNFVFYGPRGLMV
jgi:hypothetical protein